MAKYNEIVILIFVHEFTGTDG